MATEPRAGLILIVVGSALRAEEVDRPLGYFLKQRIENALRDRDDESDPPQVLVIADFRWIHDQPLHALPTISLGGPGVNALAHHWLEDLPYSLRIDNHYYIQMDPDLEMLRASIWGIDNCTTQIAVYEFVEKFLPRFLDRTATYVPHFTDPDDTF